MQQHANALVLEDSPHMRVMLTQLLHSLDVEHVDAAPCIADAKTWLDLIAYDLALIDVGLDDENGLDLVREIRLNPSHPLRRMPMIVVSGQNQWSVIAKARDAGADSFLTKPVSLGALEARVTQVLERPHPYVECDTFFGPDRRRGPSRAYAGPERRLGELWLA